MIEIPWQIVIGFLALVGIRMLIQYLREADCEERIRAAENQQHRDTMNVYRSSYQAGWQEGLLDGLDHIKEHNHERQQSMGLKPKHDLYTGVPDEYTPVPDGSEDG